MKKIKRFFAAMFSIMYGTIVVVKIDTDQHRYSHITVNGSCEIFYETARSTIFTVLKLMPGFKANVCNKLIYDINKLEYAFFRDRSAYDSKGSNILYTSKEGYSLTICKNEMRRYFSYVPAALYVYKT